MTLFKNTETASEPRKKAPTSFQYYSSKIKGRLKTTPAVEAIFMPSGNIRSYGFMCGECLRFNVYSDDPRFEECEALVKNIVENDLLVRVAYSKDDRGLATLTVDSNSKACWELRDGYYKRVG